MGYHLAINYIMNGNWRKSSFWIWCWWINHRLGMSVTSREEVPSGINRGKLYKQSLDKWCLNGTRIYNNWLVVWNIFPYIGNNNPDWRTHSFQRGWNHQPDNMLWYTLFDDLSLLCLSTRGHTQVLKKKYGILGINIRRLQTTSPQRLKFHPWQVYISEDLWRELPKAISLV